MMPDNITITFQTPNASGSWNIVSKENLEVLGKRLEDVEKIVYTDHFPGHPYLESGVAWSSHHPVIGSGSGNLFFKDGTTAHIDDIFYQDSNPNQTHANGKPHWNHERRFFLSTWQKAIALSDRIEHHIIEKSTYLEVSTRASGQAEKTVKCWWQE